jgi:hypothetical protein
MVYNELTDVAETPALAAARPGGGSQSDWLRGAASVVIRDDCALVSKRSAESQAVAALAIEAHRRLQHHSAMANESCPSSSTVARRFTILRDTVTGRHEAPHQSRR